MHKHKAVPLNIAWTQTGQVSVNEADMKSTEAKQCGTFLGLILPSKAFNLNCIGIPRESKATALESNCQMALRYTEWKKLHCKSPLTR